MADAVISYISVSPSMPIIAATVEGDVSGSARNESGRFLASFLSFTVPMIFRDSPATSAE